MVCFHLGLGFPVNFPYTNPMIVVKFWMLKNEEHVGECVRCSYHSYSSFDWVADDDCSNDLMTWSANNIKQQQQQQQWDPGSQKSWNLVNLVLSVPYSDPFCVHTLKFDTFRAELLFDTQHVQQFCNMCGLDWLGTLGPKKWGMAKCYTLPDPGLF